MSDRCNQDVLEFYFSQIRSVRIFCDHPLPTAVSQRIISLLLSRNAAVIIPTENCSQDNFITLSSEVIYGFDTDKTVNSASDKN